MGKEVDPLEVDRRALRVAVAALLRQADESDAFMGGTQPYMHTATVRRILAPWIPEPEVPEETS